MEKPIVMGLEPKHKRPWWAAPLLTGIGIGVAIIAALGFGATAHGESVPPKPGYASIGLPPGSISLDERLHNIETAIRALTTELTEVKQRLPPKHLP